MHFASLVLWIYIVLLLAGGLVGFLKAGSKVSLYMSAGFAAALAIAAVPGRPLDPAVANSLVNVLMAALLVVFAIRLAKTRKFMPSGLMLAVTALALALRNIKF